MTTLATHLHRFLTDNAFWQACGRRGTSWVRQRFDHYRQTRQLEDIYDEVVMEAKQRDAFMPPNAPKACFANIQRSLECQRLSLRCR